MKKEAGEYTTVRKICNVYRGKIRLFFSLRQLLEQKFEVATESLSLSIFYQARPLTYHLRPVRQSL
jgi:hypothetical protein